MSSFVDTHAHFCDSQFDADREEALKRAKNAGVQTIVEIAEAPEGWEKAKTLSEFSFSGHGGLFPLIYWTCGFHPHYAEALEETKFDTMKEAVSSPHCVAVGEIGLDYVKSAAPREKQISLFKKSLEVAAEFSKPVVIHCREAQPDVLRILKSFFGGSARQDVCIGVIHCFSGDIHFAQMCMELGFYLGVDGPLTYPSAKNLRDVISQTPLNRIVIETDSPYLPPQGYRGKRNESSYLPLIALKLSEIFQKNLEEVSKVTTENAARLFRTGTPHGKSS